MQKTRKYISRFNIFGRIFLMWPSEYENKSNPPLSFIKDYFFCGCLGVFFTSCIVYGFCKTGTRGLFFRTNSNIDYCLTTATLGLFYFLMIYNVTFRDDLKRILRDIDMTVNEHGETLKMIRTFKEPVFVSLVLGVNLLFEALYMNFFFSKYEFTKYLAYAYPFNITMLQLYVFFAILKVHKRVFKKINKSLYQMGVQNIVFKTQKNKFNDNFTVFYMANLRNLSELHFKCVQKVNFLNEVWAPIFTYFAGFVFSVVTVYINFLVKFIRNINPDEITLEMTVYNTIWSVLFLLLLFWTTFTWVMVAHEVRYCCTMLVCLFRRNSVLRTTFIFKIFLSYQDIRTPWK